MTSYIFQPDRLLLKKQIADASRYISGKVLDVGAGRHARYQSLFKYSEYIKMDIASGDNVDVVGSADKIPFPDENFDSVVCTQVFEHITGPFKAAGEIYRVLKKDGHCLVTAPQWNELHEEPHDYYRYTKFGLVSLFERQGFQVIQVDARGGYFTLRAQMLIRYLIDRFNLYNMPLAGRVASRMFTMYGKVMMWLDTVDKSEANRKHTIGWCAVFKK